MSTETQISSSFWKGLITVATVVSATIYIRSSLDTAFEKNLSPLVKKIEENEREIAVLKNKTNGFMYKSAISSAEAGKLIDFINDKFKTHFLKPNEIKIEEDR